MRFTIRDLLWLMVVMALGVGWYFDRSWLWGQAYVNNLRAEQRDGEFKDLIEGLETLPDKQLEEVRDHLKKRRQVISSAGVNGAGGTALPTSQAPAPNPPKD